MRLTIKLTDLPSNKLTNTQVVTNILRMPSLALTQELIDSIKQGKTRKE